MDLLGVRAGVVDILGNSALAKTDLGDVEQTKAQLTGDVSQKWASTACSSLGALGWLQGQYINSLDSGDLSPFNVQRDAECFKQSEV